MQGASYPMWRWRVWFFTGPRSSQNGLDLAGCEVFSAVVVAHFLQFVPQHVVTAYHGHEVLDGGFGGAVGEVEEGEFFLGVGAGFFIGC